MHLRLWREIRCSRSADDVWDCINQIGQIPPKWAPIISTSLHTGKHFFLWDNAGIPTLHGEDIHWKSYVLLDVIEQPNGSRIILKVSLSNFIIAMICASFWVMFTFGVAYANRSDKAELVMVACAGILGVSGFIVMGVTCLWLGKAFMDRIEKILRDQIYFNPPPVDV